VRKEGRGEEGRGEEGRGEGGGRKGRRDRPSSSLKGG
jgi:hypothetical protein